MVLLELLISILKYLLPFLFDQKKLEKKYFKIIWKKSSDITPEDILDIRGQDEHGFREYYYKRDIDEEIRNKIIENKNLFIIGNPLAGKSRAVYELLKNFGEKVNVIIPTMEGIKFEEFTIPKKIGLGRKIAVYNDIDKHTSKQNFNYQLEQLLKDKIQIIATCQTGDELEIVKSALNKDFTTIFGKPIKIEKIDSDQAAKISKAIDKVIPNRFDGNVGSIFISLDKMRYRYENLSDIDKQILINIKFLYIAGMFNEIGVFSKNNIKHLSKHDSELELANYEWENVLKD